MVRARPGPARRAGRGPARRSRARPAARRGQPAPRSAPAARRRGRRARPAGRSRAAPAARRPEPAGPRPAPAARPPVSGGPGRAAGRRRPPARRGPVRGGPPAPALRRASPARRLHASMLCIVFVLALFAARLVQLQGLDWSQYRTLAEQQMLPPQPIPIPVLRGSITSSDGTVLAMTVQTDLVYADPLMIPPSSRGAGRRRAGRAARHDAGRPSWRCSSTRARRSTWCCKAARPGGHRAARDRPRCSCPASPRRRPTPGSTRTATSPPT